jgi:putative endonuclease
LGLFGERLSLCFNMKQNSYSVYIMTNQTQTVLYVGMTSDLVGRVWQHKNKEFEKSFSAKYNVVSLIYYEDFSSASAAIEREKQLKNWKREWKVELIEKENPEFIDLSAEWDL